MVGDGRMGGHGGDGRVSLHPGCNFEVSSKLRDLSSADERSSPSNNGKEATAARAAKTNIGGPKIGCEARPSKATQTSTSSAPIPNVIFNEDGDQ